MKTKDATVKVGKGDAQRTVWTGKYTYPETLEEAVEVDGEDKIMKVYLVKRYTNFLDVERRKAMTNAIPKVMLDKIRSLWKSGDKAKLELVCETLGIDMDDIKTMI